MALVTTTLTPKVFKVPFTGPGEQQRQGSRAARAEIYFSINSGAWAAAGAGNDRSLVIPLSLPKDFAYLCTDVSLQVRTASTYTYASNAAVLTFTPDPSTNGFAPYYTNMVSPMWTGATPAVQAATTTISAAQIRNENQIIIKDAVDPVQTSKTYTPEKLPSFLLFPYTDTRYQSNADVTLGDVLESGNVASIFFLARFVQYDISQAYSWAPNSPVL